MKNARDYNIISFPASRQFTIDIGRLGSHKHHIKALLEVDVTAPWNVIGNLKKDPDSNISFTAWILKCISQAVAENRQVHALKERGNRLVIFNDVDISIVVEKEVNGVPVPLPLVIRNADKKNISDIYNEIDMAKKIGIDDQNNYTLDKDRKNYPLKLFLLLPRFIRLLLWKIILSDPWRVKNMMGTVMFSSVGTAGDVSGWGIPYSIHPLSFTLGSIIRKPGVVNDTIEVRDILHMTVLIDHDVVDGAPAARFLSRLKDMIENGYGL